MNNRHTGGAREAVTVGIVGTTSSIRHIMEVADSLGSSSMRLTSMACEREADTRRQALKLAEDADVVLFSGPLSYDRMMADGGLPIPAVYVPPGGPALPMTLLRWVRETDRDLQRISIDSVLERDVRDTYAEIGVEPSGVRVKEYTEAATVADFYEFHRSLYEAGETSGAITTIPAVATDLSDLGVPTLTMRPDAITVRGALSTALLVGGGASLENSRMAIMIVRLPVSESSNSTSLSNYAFQELKVAVHSELLDEARRMDATVVPRDDTSFLIIATMGSLRAATQELTIAPLADRVRAALGVRPEVGIGVGRTTAEAEHHALEAVDRSASERSTALYMVGPQGAIYELPSRDDHEGPKLVTTDPEESRGSGVLRQVIDALNERGDEERLVDAERVAELLGVTPRTARRQLRGLAQAGLAWPMPSEPTNKVGRPPMLYQLLDQRLPN